MYSLCFTLPFHTRKTIIYIHLIFFKVLKNEKKNHEKVICPDKTSNCLISCVIYSFIDFSKVWILLLVYFTNHNFRYFVSIIFAIKCILNIKCAILQCLTFNRKILNKCLNYISRFSLKNIFSIKNAIFQLLRKVQCLWISSMKFT